MKLLALIPARGGSKGVPRKNIRILGDKPLIWYSYAAALQSSLFSEIVLTTDNEEIAQIGKSIGFMVPFIRPSSLANDSAKSIDVVKHALVEMKVLGYVYDAVVLLQPTSPFRQNDLIKTAISIFKTQKADSLISVRKTPHQFNPHWVFETGAEGMLHIATGDNEIIGRRQELPDAYYRDGQLYITKTKVLIEKSSFIGDRLTYILNEKEGSAINIDTEADWLIAKKHFIKNESEYIYD